MPLRKIGMCEFVKVIIANRLLVFNRKMEFLNFITTPMCVILGGMFGVAYAQNFFKFPILPLSSPPQIYNSTNIGDYHLGYPEIAFN